MDHKIVDQLALIVFRSHLATFSAYYLNTPLDYTNHFTKSISPDTISKICSTVENVSSYVQQLSWIIWARVNKKAEELPFDEAAEVLVDENAALFESLTAPLSGPQMGFLRALRDGINSGFTSYAILEKYQLGTPGTYPKSSPSLQKKS